ncbi:MULTISPECIES: hypothetical protein [Enterobacter cloacae complex]|nr:hypothetical protein [Enterobacter hormaechei]AVU51321.1 hypothetical protein AXJ76_15100 [Enterobacter cloacae]EHE7812880.1 hypothetical protein [Enterobacter hormaechei]EHF3578476.1 hypothetical protein [Enterobacter hormaechei]KJN71839.1 hypothetical protein SS48_22370 [Enterobacter hormaechei subsp. xiangfangensis]KUH54817.1 hypothetical protein APR64_04065 [Enterobacter hormaechei]
MSNIDKRAQKELYAKVEQQAHSLRGSPREYQALTGMCPVNVIEMHAQKIQALLDELEAKDNRINRLEAIVAVAEQRNALMREWKRALKVPRDLVDDQVPVVIHGMVIRLERLKETEEKLEAAEKRNERALSLLKDASPENVWEIIGRLKVVISGDYRSEAEIAAAAGKGE